MTLKSCWTSSLSNPTMMSDFTFAQSSSCHLDQVLKSKETLPGEGRPNFGVLLQFYLQVFWSSPMGAPRPGGPMFTLPIPLPLLSHCVHLWAYHLIFFTLDFGPGQLASFMFILSYEAVYKPAVLKVHPPISGGGEGIFFFWKFLDRFVKIPTGSKTVLIKCHFWGQKLNLKKNKCHFPFK